MATKNRNEGLENMKQGIRDAFYRVFPESYISISDGCLGGGLYIKCYLQKPEEWSNKISHNDPLDFMAGIDAGLTWREHSHSLIQKATEPFMAYSTVKLRRKTIHEANAANIEKRFEQLKAFVADHLDNAVHDIADKVK